MFLNIFYRLFFLPLFLLNIAKNLRTTKPTKKVATKRHNDTVIERFKSSVLFKSII